ncbi:MAG: hypothetical protein QM756_41980 [Polyangiaceae bacterium]
MLGAVNTELKDKGGSRQRLERTAFSVQVLPTTLGRAGDGAAVVGSF